MWLWYEKEHITFCDSYRVGGFVEFESETQFAPLAENLALLAVDEVHRYRSHYPSVRAAAERLVAMRPRVFWMLFHTAIACGLAGRWEDAKHWFEEVIRIDEPGEWSRPVVSLAREYLLAVDDPQGFRNRIEAVVRRTRRWQRLDEIADVRFD